MTTETATMSPPAAAHAPVPDALDAAIATACQRVAPLWPLKHFVAVNPFLGFIGQGFGETAATLRRVTKVDMLMPRQFYRDALANGIITDTHIAQALAHAPANAQVPADVGLAKASLAREPGERVRGPGVVATIAEVLDKLAAGDRQASRTEFMVDEISRWCAAYFDEGQASWQMPQRGASPWAAWRDTMRHDRNAEAMGIKGFRRIVASLPDDPLAAIALIVGAIGIPERAQADYLHRALFDIGGWAAYVRYLVWDNGLYGRADNRLVELLAIRMAWGYALFQQRTDAAFQAAWAAEMRQAAELPDDAGQNDDPDLALLLVFQEAYEIAWQQQLLGKLARNDAAPQAFQLPSRDGRKPLQAAFCIDVRSEVYRRALEQVVPGGETIGFAGFFGYSIEYIPIGRETGGAHCPVLLTPSFTVCEMVNNGSVAEETEVLGLRLLRRRAAKAWKSFKQSAVSSFTYVEAVGLAFAPKLVSDAMGFTRTVSDPNTDGFDQSTIGRLGPRLEPRQVGGRMTGLDAGQRLAQGEAVLRAMSMTSDFGRIVLLAGHGSTTANNPHASGLDCGACGGHTGEANARIAADILNDPGVRAGLVGKGIEIPSDTWFLSALHDTTTDDVTLYDRDRVPAALRPYVAEVEAWLARASTLARAERSRFLDLDMPKADIDAQVIARSRDWAQVRPEWGLAGNGAFIAAPRKRTLGIDLGGRSFLHDYDWQQDKGFGILTLIMTAPMVVASWINLQYYGSVVNNQVWGAGNKVLHNVVGTLGVLEGNGGDLKTGLAWQSVHDGTRFLHEPLRLNVFIEAPLAAMTDVIMASQMVRDLVDNQWLHLWAIDDSGRVSHRYQRDGEWAAL
ncbi:MAG: YbcC family protein [Sandarakinorhabdus sp.]